MTPASPPDPAEERVLLLTPTLRDGELATAMLAEAGIASHLCPSLADLCGEIAGPVGAIFLPEETLVNGGVDALRACLDRQPPWSDLPILLLVRGGGNSAPVGDAVARLGNVTLLERPLRVATLVSAVRTALRARRRQYQIREHLLERARSNELLESRVVERTAVAEQRAAQLSALANELIHTEARERRRLAQILHDHLQQLLVAARLSLGLALARASDDAARAPIQRANDLIVETIEESRSLTVELSPPILYEGGLAPALQWLGRWMGEKHGLVVTTDCDAAGDPTTDEGRVLLFQAARELLFNVVKHAQTPAARLSLERVSGGATRVTVEDRGAGFDARADTDSLADAGDHFGLFSIRERLQALGGTLCIRSAPDSGTVCTIELPPVRDPLPARRHGDPATTPAPRSAPRTHASRPRSDRIAVLLADDHKILREGLAGLLREEPDIDVVGQASDGREAVELAERLRPHLIVMDVTMPGLTGIEATRQITARVPDARIIALSMHDQSDMAAAMREAGAAAYLTKGGPAETLIECIRSLGAGAGTMPSDA